MLETDIFIQLTELLTQHQAKFRVVEHPSAGKSVDVAKIRGTQLGQGAKGLVCHVKGNGVRQHILAVLPADKQADLQKIAAAIGGLAPHWPAPKKCQN